MFIYLFLRRLVELMRETNFNGVTGHVYFHNSSRVSDVLIYQWVNYSEILIGIYKALTPDKGELKLNETNIKWLTANGLKPADGSGYGEKALIISFRFCLYIALLCTSFDTYAILMLTLIVPSFLV